MGAPPCYNCFTTLTMARGGVLDAMYLDYAKAFDSVPHRRLLAKLESYGITDRILTWVESFLTGRFQSVLVNGNKSFSAPVVSGIPQGSVLGPLLLIIYINDLPDSVTSNLYMFADDS